MTDHKADGGKCRHCGFTEDRHNKVGKFCPRTFSGIQVDWEKTVFEPAPPPSEEPKVKCDDPNCQGFADGFHAHRLNGQANRPFGLPVPPASVSPKVTPERVEGPKMPDRFQPWAEPAWRDGYTAALATKDAEIAELKAALGRCLDYAKHLEDHGMIRFLKDALKVTPERVEGPKTEEPYKQSGCKVLGEFQGSKIGAIYSDEREAKDAAKRLNFAVELGRASAKAEIERLRKALAEISETIKYHKTGVLTKCDGCDRAEESADAALGGK